MINTHYNCTSFYSIFIILIKLLSQMTFFTPLHNTSMCFLFLYCYVLLFLVLRPCDVARHIIWGFGRTCLLLPMFVNGASMLLMSCTKAVWYIWKHYLRISKDVFTGSNVCEWAFNKLCSSMPLTSSTEATWCI